MPDIGTILAVLQGVLSIQWKTHRPSSDELGGEYEWFLGSPDRGLIRCFTIGGQPHWRWRGEILARSDTGFPVASWDYDRQTFDPIGAVTLDGSCMFWDVENLNRIMSTPDSIEFLIGLVNDDHPGGYRTDLTWDEIGDKVSPRDKYSNRQIAEQRGQSWDQMEADAQWILNNAAANGVPIYPSMSMGGRSVSESGEPAGVGRGAVALAVLGWMMRHG